MISWVLLIGAAALFVWLAWRTPQAAVLTVIVLIPSYLFRLSLFGFSTNPLEIGVVLLFGIQVLRPQARSLWRKRVAALPPSLMLWAALFLLAGVISTLRSAQPSVSWGILKGWILIPIVLGWLVVSLGSGQGWVRRVIQSLLVSGVLTAALSLLLWQSPDRLAGLYDVPNSLALWLVPITALMFWTEYGIRRLIGGALLASTVLATQSVGAMAALVVTIVIGSALWRRAVGRRRALGLTLLLGAVALALLLGTGRVSYFLQRDVPTSATVRWQLWQVSAQLIRAHPVFGVGLGQFEPHYQTVLHQRFAQAEQWGSRSPIPEFVFRDPHNWVLSFWLNVGIVGLISFIGLHIAAWRHVRSQLTNQSVQGVILALVALLIFGLVDTIYWKNDLAAVHWALLSLLTVAGFLPDQD